MPIAFRRAPDGDATLTKARVLALVVVFGALAGAFVLGRATSPGVKTLSSRPVVPTTVSSSVATSTTTSLPQQTTTPPVPTTVPAPGAFSAFSAAWFFHGFGAIIAADGSGQANWRVYKWCKDDPTPPCDDLIGNQIIDGGSAQLRLTSVQGSVAYGQVSYTTDPKTVPLGALIVRLVTGDHLQFGSVGQPLCGPTAPTDSCGA
jgi:hypothetical protein